jgi:iron complex transport system substrate-binding protein
MVVGEDNLSTVFMRSLGPDVPEDLRDAPATAALALQEVASTPQ